MKFLESLGKAVVLIALVAGALYLGALYEPVEIPRAEPRNVTPYIYVVDSPDPVTVAKSPHSTIELKPEYRKILKETGYLDYVLSNIEVLQLVDYQAVWSNGEDAVGLSDIKDGKRWALATTKGRSDSYVCATLVHEATHLKGYKEIGYMAGQPDAYEAQHDFERKYAKLHPVGDLYPLAIPISIGLSVTCADGTVTEGSCPQN